MCIYVAASQLKRYAGVNDKVSGGQTAEGVRRDSEGPPQGARKASPSHERNKRIE